jgi:small subunit ribosomal protein S9
MSKFQTSVFIGLGRRKTAVARVRIQKGSGAIQINQRPLETYFPGEALTNPVLAPLKLVELHNDLDVRILVQGGGLPSQASAIAMGIARALQTMNSELRAPLKKAGFLTRDSRMKERKKPGQPGARKRFQFSKR